MSADISEIAAKMIEFSDGNVFDINHFMKVHGFARLIGLGEGLGGSMLETLEIAALVHDIGIQRCREKYGSTNGRLQEKEGMALAREFLRQFDLPSEQLARIVYLVGHHHSYFVADGIDYQILLEADFITVAGESPKFVKHDVEEFAEAVFRTKTGLRLLRSMYRLEKTDGQNE
ncbi:MAG: HD domain-containing protein [Lachnospiraceae bacterium]|nr:HD domain-containing protein [Lachnospiraceae bacterium]